MGLFRLFFVPGGFSADLLMVAFLVAGRSYRWFSRPVGGLLVVSILGAIAFYWAGKRALDPVLPLNRLLQRDFGLGNLHKNVSKITSFL